MERALREAGMEFLEYAPIAVGVVEQEMDLGVV